jgi:hypothetical protein
MLTWQVRRCEKQSKLLSYASQSAEGLLVTRGVAVEKLVSEKSAEITSRQDAL